MTKEKKFDDIDTRVIIQLMMYHNKAYLLNIPGKPQIQDPVAPIDICGSLRQLFSCISV